MENVLDVFKGDGFTLTTMTDAIDKQPFVPGQVGQMGLFKEEGISTLTVEIEEREGQLYLIPAKQRGAPPTQNPKNPRKVRDLRVVHLPMGDTVMADEVQGVRAFGQGNQFETVEQKVNEKLATIKQSFEATLEHMRVGALKGIVMDADGTTPLYDLYEKFNVQPLTAVNFKLDADNPGEQDVKEACNQVIREMQGRMGNMPYVGMGALVGADFMDLLSMHPETREAWKRWQEGLALRQSYVYSSFFYGGITFQEYRGSVGDVDFIEAGEARFFPMGTPGLFRTLYGPADYAETVNTIGLPLYAKQIPLRNDKGTEIEVQSNPLVYCTRPGLLRQGLAAS